jgi:hypothetical protein
MTWFYEIRSSNNAVLKRDGGFALKTPRRLPDVLCSLLAHCEANCH